MTKGIAGNRVRTRGRTASALFAVLGLVLLSSGLSLVVQGSASAAAVVHKSYVCKYVGKPGVNERLQTGQNPIWVDNSALGAHGGLTYVGETFSDGQHRSVVIVANTPRLKPEPLVAACPGVVTPDVLFTDSTCVNGQPSSPAWMGQNLADITYTLTSGTVGNGNTITITAAPKPGFAFPPTAPATFTHTFGPVATCQAAATVVTPSVTFTDSVCNSGVLVNPSWTGAHSDEISYVVSGGALASGSPITITASPKSGFAFPPGAQTTFSHTFAVSPTCQQGGNVEAVVPPVFKDATCPAVGAVAVNLGGQGFLTPAEATSKGNFLDVNHVTYTLTGQFQSGGTIHVAASADTGYKLGSGAATSWTHTFAVVKCPVGGPSSGAGNGAGNSVAPVAIHSGLTSIGTTPVGTNGALMAWGYGLAGSGVMVFTMALVFGRRRQTVS